MLIDFKSNGTSSKCLGPANNDACCCSLDVRLEHVANAGVDGVKSSLEQIFDESFSPLKLESFKW